MKKIVLIVTILLLVPLCFKSFGTPIVNNSGNSSEDTLTFNILNLLPSGNPAEKLDSAYFTVFKSNSNDIIFRDSSSGVGMTGVDSFVIGGDVVYYFHQAVANIDGAGAVGLYSYNFLSVYDDSSMRTPTLGQFQITGWELDDIGDSAGLAANGIDKSLDSLHLMIDSLMAILDTLQNQDDWVGRAVNQTIINDNVLLVIDTVNGIIDTLQNQDDWISTLISGLSSGGGGYSFQLVVVDSGISQVIPGVGLAIRNLDQSALVAVGTSDILGVASFNLNVASYVAIASSPGYIFENFDTVVVSGSGLDTLYGYQFDPGTPADPDLCRVYGYLYDIEGNPEYDATVAAWLPSGVGRLGSTIVSPFRKETKTDNAGYFYIDLIPSADLTPATGKYEIAITLSDGTVLRERLLVPDLSSWMLTW